MHFLTELRPFFRSPTSVRNVCVNVKNSNMQCYVFQGAKVFNYARMQSTCDVIFALFAIIFFVSRLVIYPGW